MLKFIWKLRFALFMKHVAKTSFSFGWECADGWAASFGTDEHPHDAVYEELSCWDDDGDGL